MKLLGWCDAYTSPYKEVNFTNERRQALIECIRRRHYNLNHNDHTSLPYCAPFYDDQKICVLTKAQWDSVMDEVYANMPRRQRLLPMDAIKTPPKNGVLYEKNKKEGEENV